MTRAAIFWTLFALSSQFLEIAPTSRRSLAASSLGNHVVNVVGCCAEKKMVNIDARRVVATVQNLEAIRERAISQFVGCSVSQEVPAARTSGAKYPIAVSVSHANPKHAAGRRCWTNVLIKPYAPWDCLPPILTLLGAKPTTAQLELTWVGNKRKHFAAGLARSFSWIIDGPSRHGSVPL